ncbi:MAG: 4-hydroxy-tetrahydrodipicolinate reductase [Rhodobacteraceae bacterium]|nr:4-hydroxy-tetrahydrodipicolinate reductase [Paracoccaceae bacterium]
MNYHARKATAVAPATTGVRTVTSRNPLTLRSVDQDSIGIAVMGGAGRMGQMLLHTIAESEQAHLAGVTVRAGHPWVGQDLDAAPGGVPSGVPVFDDPLDAIARAQAVIDFTTPEATVDHARLCAQARATHVIGTTGFASEHLQEIAAAARHTTIIRAGNMSLGVNLLVQLTRQVAGALGEEFDIEVIETHHNQKVDAPSGTALMLGDAAAEGRGKTLDDLAERGRDGITSPRRPGSIGFSAVRGGDIVGEHDVLFAGLGERIVLRHIATDRRIFARGAVKAALWGQTKGPGEFSMIDVLGLD